jgi:hypothetical protein
MRLRWRHRHLSQVQYPVDASQAWTADGRTLAELPKVFLGSIPESKKVEKDKTMKKLPGEWQICEARMAKSSGAEAAVAAKQYQTGEH